MYHAHTSVRTVYHILRLRKPRLPCNESYHRESVPLTYVLTLFALVLSLHMSFPCFYIQLHIIIIVYHEQLKSALALLLRRSGTIMSIDYIIYLHNEVKLNLYCQVVPVISQYNTRHIVLSINNVLVDQHIVYLP